MFYWIYDISTESLTLLFAAVFVGFTWFGIILLDLSCACSLAAAITPTSMVQPASCMNGP